jgi:dynein heavy chain
MQQRVVNLSKKYLAEMGRHYYVTPTSYLELINTFKKLLNVQRTGVLEAKARYDNGLAKLRETADKINAMQKQLEVLQPELEQSTIATELLIAKATEEAAIAKEQQAIVEAEEKIVNEKVNEAAILKEACDQGLAAALPNLERAKDAVKNLNDSHIFEMKTMKTPSKAIKMTMAALCTILNIPRDRKIKDVYDSYWGNAKKELLNNPNFKGMLYAFQADKIDESIINATKANYTSKEEFEVKNVSSKGRTIILLLFF